MSTAYLQAPDNVRLDHIPGDYGWPVLGYTFDLVKDFYSAVSRQYERYGPVSKFGLAGFKGVLVLGPDLYQQIYLDSDRNFSARMGYERSLGKFYKGALLLQDFDEHRFQRRLMQNAFKTPAMKEYLETLSPMLDKATASWRGQQDFHFFPAIKQTLLDVAARIFIGLDALGDDARQLNRAFLDIADGLMGLVDWDIPGTKYYKGKRAQRQLEEFFLGLIPYRRNGSGGDTLTHFCQATTEDGSFFSEQDIIRHISFLLFAAHDTTTSALSHLLYRVGQDPEWQERLRAEALSLGEGPLTYEQLEQMVDTDNAVKETLRLHPSVMMMQRRTIRDCELGGLQIPANTVLFIAPQFTHRMTEWWDQPERFDPDRFAEPRNEHKRHPFSFVGFGGGAHKCIGMHFAMMQAKSFLYHFLRRYRFELPVGYAPKLQTVPLPKPMDDLPLKLYPL